VALEPENADLKRSLRNEYEASGQWRKVAELVIAEAEKTNPSDKKVALYREAATIFAERCSDLGSAGDVLTTAVALSPDDRQLMLELCDALSGSGRGDSAIEVLQKIVESYGGKRAKE